jgi:hypothetical protein
MKKVFLIIAVLVLGLNYTKAQLRLTEIAPFDDYFELYYGGDISLNNFRVIVWTKNSSTQSIVVGTFKQGAVHAAAQSSTTGVSAGTISYSLNPVQYLENFKNNGQIPTGYLTSWANCFNTSGTSAVFDKYTLSNGSFTKTGTVSSLFVDVAQNTKIAVFLVNGSTASDYLVDELSTEADLRAIGSLTLSGGPVINFSNITLTSDKYVGEALGSGQSYQNAYLSGSSTTSCLTKWTKGGIGYDGGNANFTPGFSIGFTNNFLTWNNDTYFVSQTGDQISLTLDNNNLTAATASGTIPSASPSYSKEGSNFYLTLYTKIYNLSGALPSSLQFSLFNDDGSTTAFYDATDSKVSNFQINGVQYTTNLPVSNVTPLSGTTDISAYYYKFKVPLVITGSSTSGNTTTYQFNNVLLNVNAATSNCYSSTILFRTTSVLALPVTFSDISLKTIYNANNIKWSTLTEQNNKGFEIQRSIGNANEFKTIGFVGTRAKDGNSQTEISYSFEDADVKAGQTHYYRLNQIDFDGKSAFSPVKSIKPGSIESNLNVYPNPSQGSFTVNTGSNSGKLNIFVMDNTGRVVNQFMNVSTSNTRINNLRKGFYTLKIVNTESGEQSAQRVVVQ